MVQARQAAAVCGLLAAAMCGGCASAPGGTATAEAALRCLREGNVRYAAGHPRHPHESAARRAETAREGQHPLATVLACSDSRVPVELVFDQGVGDLFVIRVAGNVCGEEEIGTVEYAVEHLHTPLVVVLGHESCGAVTACVEGVHAEGSLGALLHHIDPAVAAARAAHPERHGEALVATAVRCNVQCGVEELLRGSRVIREAAERGEVFVRGAVYDLRSGQVEWLAAAGSERAAGGPG